MRNIKYEFYKLLIKRKGILIILIFMFIKLLTLTFSVQSVNSKLDENLTVYNEYMVNISGKLNIEKESYIINEKNKITKASSLVNKIIEDYQNGSITEEEYTDKILSLNKVLDKQRCFNIIYSQYEYVKKDTNRRYFLYTQGWNALLGKEQLDWAFMLLLMMVVTPVFAFEYESGMFQILLSCKKGKKSLAFSKIIVIIVISSSLSAVFSIMEFMFINFKLGLQSGDFPIQSLEFYSTAIHNISLIKAFILISVIKAAGYCFFSLLISFFSVVTKRTLVSLFAGSTIILIPYFIAPLGELKYKIPIPLGFMLSNGYFRGNGQNFKAITANQFMHISGGLVVIFVGIFAGTILIYSGINYRRLNR